MGVSGYLTGPYNEITLRPMGPSRAVVVGGLRTLPRSAWRSGVDAAVAVVITQPVLWLTGALGFLLRGGIFVLIAAVIVLPTPIEVRSFLGEGLGSAGFSPALIQTAVGVGAVALSLVMVGLFVLGWIELSAYERIVADHELDGQREGRRLVRLNGRARRRLLIDLFAVQWAAFSFVALAAVPLVLSAFDVTYREILRPTGGEALYLRVVGNLGQPLFMLTAAVVIVEILAATASRSLLARRLLERTVPEQREPRESLGRVLAAGLRTLLTALLGWSVTLALVVPALWALSLVWQQVRTTLLLPTTPDAGTAGLVVAGLLAAAWLAGIVLAGFASALRSALWSVESLH